ncbi:unnamed protein product [Allacma fusca]|uniref:Uncharacterized protein n=1 Tax=Allacma fusca TaxID=39272 RepID=A0A8J2LBI1_9HEXA|nr:unnamed protein product [Allacma fusca]
MGKLSLILQNLQKSVDRQRQNFVIPTISIENLLERMPAKTSTALEFCNCFTSSGSSSDPPEITVNGLLDQNLVIQSPPTNLNSEEFEEQFAEFVEELDLTAVNKNAMLSLPINKKWQIYSSRKNNETDTLLSFSPEYFIDRISAFMPQETPKLFESLRTSLRTQPNSFVQRFLDLEGLNILLETLSNHKYLKYHPGIIQCMKSILNNSTGRAYVLAHPSALNIVSESLASDNIKCKVDVLEILGAVCLVPGGHRKVLGAISYLQEFASERTRFQTIINDLDRSTGLYRTDISVKTAIMSFLNAVLSYGPGQSSLEFRLHLRYELLMLGLQPVIDKLRKFDNETLDKHLDFFEMMRIEDEKEFAKRFDHTHIDVKNTQENFTLLNSKLTHSSSFANLQSIIQHLLLLPIEITHHWSLIDRLIQQVVLQESSKDPDHVVVNIDVDKIVKELASEEQLTTATKKVEHLSAENTKLLNSTSLKEQELEIRTQEKENLEKIIKTLREKLKEANNRPPVIIQQVVPPPQPVPQPIVTQPGPSVIQQQPTAAQPKETEVLPPAIKVQLPEPNQTAKPIPEVQQPVLAPPPPPPPPPLVPGSIPPPPPPAPPLTQSPHPVVIRRQLNVPQPKTQLKALNWSKLPDTKLNGTVWLKLEESKIYSQLNLVEIDRLFSAFKHVNGNSEKDMESITQSNHKPLKKVISVIDGRRAQNCTILLSKLKMTDDEITRAILSMDQMDQLPLDMIEQLLKFTPNNEEKQLLEEQDMEMLARADTFLLQISRIPHYSERLRALHYKKKFPIITSELKSKVRTVTQALLELQTSKKLIKLLELILALGNYMNNHGSRGNAAGFRLNSLMRIQDTKSNYKISLMNYLITQIESCWPDLLDIDFELRNLKTAAKVNMADLDKEMCGLRSSMNLIEKEVEFHRSVKMEPGDRFLISMREFTSTAANQLCELEDSYSTMKCQFHKTLLFFGEEYATTDEFLQVFDQFFGHFNEARMENDNLRKKKEDEYKRAENATLRRQSTKSASSNPNIQTEKGEFDDLISALRTAVFSPLLRITVLKSSYISADSNPKGDVFTADTDIKNYKRKRANNNSQRSPANFDQRERTH